MKINLKKSISVLLLLCLILSIAIPAFAVSGGSGADMGPKQLNAVFEEAKFKDIGLDFYIRELGFENGVAIAADEAGSFGLVDRKGTPVVPYQYQGIDMMEDGLYRVTEGPGIYGVINARGEVLVPPQEQLDIGMMNGILHVSNNADGIYDSHYYHPDMTPSSSVEYDTPTGRSYNGYKYYVNKNGQKGVLDSKGNVFIRAEDYSYLNIYTNGSATMFHTAKTLPGDKYLDQYWDTAHQEIISDQDYDSVYTIGAYDNEAGESGWYFEVRKGNQKAVFDYSRSLIVPWGNYTDVGYMGAEGYFYAEENINRSYVSHIYHNGACVRTLTDIELNKSGIPGVAQYHEEGKPSHVFWGLIDFKGDIVIPARSDYMSASFQQGVDGQILVSTYKKEEGIYFPQLAYVDVYDTEFKPIPGLHYDSIEPVENRWYLVHDKMGDVFGLYDSKNLFAFPTEYTSIRPIGTHMFLLEKDGKYSLVNDQNQTIIAPTSNSIIVPGQSLADVPSQQDYYDARMAADYVKYYYSNYVEIMTDRGKPYKTVIPVVSNSGTWANPVFRTFYVDLETGEAEGYLDCLASAIDSQGRFAYQDMNGMMGFGSLAPEAVSDPHLWVTGGQADDQNNAVVRIVLDNQQVLKSGAFQLNYDSSACTVTGATSLVSGGEVISNTPGQVQFKWAPKAAENSQALLEVHFNAANQIDLKLNQVSLTKADGSAVTVKLHHGTILPKFVQMQSPSAENTDIHENGSGRLSVSADIAFAAGNMNMTSKPMDATLIIAPYTDGKMSLTGFAVQKIQIHFDENGIARFPVGLTCRKDTDLVKVFLLSTDGEWIPFANTADIPIRLPS